MQISYSIMKGEQGHMGVSFEQYKSLSMYMMLHAPPTQSIVQYKSTSDGQRHSHLMVTHLTELMKTIDNEMGIKFPITLFTVWCPVQHNTKRVDLVRN